MIKSVMSLKIVAPNDYYCIIFNPKEKKRKVTLLYGLKTSKKNYHVVNLSTFKKDTI